ncbi:hypothetical protein NQ152_00645 [Microbacterium sp. zg.B48]|uniref:hypothetical protein n=1 Tax=Microbacterium sp. zg.B48 TaxID=2969408 RepID=UPI00214C4E89|nr:hypothetical protein [Microbacterium sp. zg.B48]MCR2762007.1 hypothetical protein [Microbacterium sp. zg.B48]
MADASPADARSRDAPRPRARPASYLSRSSVEFGRGISFFDAIYGFAARSSWCSGG